MNKLSNIKRQQLGIPISNWINITDQTFINSTIDYTVSGINGDIDNIYRILFTCKGGSIDAQANNAYMLLNNDNIAGHYNNTRMWGGNGGSSNTGGGSSNYGTNGMFIGEVRVGATLFSEILLDTKTGKNRQAHVYEALQRTTTEAYAQIFSTTYLNSSSLITSFVFYCPQTILVSEIQVYKQQDISYA